MKLPTIPHDKAVHFIYGAVIALVTMHACMAFAGVDQLWAKGAGLLATVAAGAFKEYVLDRGLNKRAVARGEPPPHTVSAGDAIATALGGVLILVA